MPRRPAPALGFTLALVTGCGGSTPTDTVQPEPVDSLVLYDSYGELLVALLSAMLAGDIAKAQASIATPGQLETMCPGFRVAVTPYTPTSLPDASQHCAEVFQPIPAEVLEGSLNTHEYGRTHDPQPASGFADYWGAKCPDFELYQIWGIFEAQGEGLPQAGVEVNEIFTYKGRWGLAAIPRCRGEGE